MQVSLKSVVDINQLNRSIDFTISGSKDITVEYDYLRCTNICMISKSTNYLDELKQELLDVYSADVRVAVVDSIEHIETYKDIVYTQTDVPYLVVIDLNKISPLEISNLLIESSIVGVNTLLLLNSQYVVGGYFMLPFCESLNNKDYVNGIINIDALDKKAIINTATFI